MSDQAPETTARQEVRAVKLALRQLAKPRETYHFDEDTIPHAHCLRPLRCDCECEGVCGQTKRQIAKRAVALLVGR